MPYLPYCIQRYYNHLGRKVESIDICESRTIKLTVNGHIDMWLYDKGFWQLT